MFRRRQPDNSTPARGLLAAWGIYLLLPVALFLAFILTALLALVSADRGTLLKRAALLHLRHALQREVDLERVEFSEHGRLTVIGLEVKEPDGKQRFAAARRVDIRFDPRRMFRLPFLPLNAISAVDIARPYARLTRDAVGQWNFHDFLERPSKPSKDVFRGALRLHGGELVYQDAMGFSGTPFSEHLTNVEIRTTRASTAYLPFTFRATPRSGHVERLEVTGSVDLAHLRAQGTVLHQGFNLALLREHLPARFLHQLHIDSGMVDGRWQVAAAFHPGQPLSLTLTGLADLHDVRGTARLERVLPFHIARGQLALANDAIELIGVEGRIGGVPVMADGELSGPEFATVAIQARTEGAAMAQLACVIPGLSEIDANWSGVVTGWAQLSGTLPDVTVVGHAAGLSVALDKLAVSDLRGDIRFTGNSLTLTNLTGRGFGGVFTGNAWATAGKTPHFLFTGDVCDIDARTVMTTFIPPPEKNDAFSPHDITGRLSGPLSAKLTGTDKLDIVTQPRGKVIFGAYPESEITASLRIQVMRNTSYIQVDRLAAKTPLGAIDLRGNLDERNNLDFTVRASEVKLGAVAALVGQKDVTGTGFATGTLTGTLTHPIFTGDFHAVKGTIAAKPFTDITGSVKAALGEKSDVMVSNLRVLAGGSRVDLDATVSARGADHWALSGRATLPRTSLAALLKTIGLDVPLDGFVEGKVDIENAPANLRGSGRLVLSRPTFTFSDTAMEFDSAEIPFTLQGKTLTLANAVLSYQGNPITISGALSLDPTTPVNEQLALSISAPKVVIDSLVSPITTSKVPFTPVSFTDGDVCLPFDADGALAVTATVRASLTPREKEAPEQALRRTLRVDATAHTIDIVNIAGVPFTNGHIAASYVGASETLTLTRFALARSGPSAGYAVTLAADSTFQVSDQELDMRFALSRANVQIGADLAQLRADALTVLRNLCDIPGRADALKAISAIPTPFGGTATLTLRLMSTVQRPVVRAALTLRGLRMGGNPLPDVDGAITYDTAPRLITIEKLSLHGGADRIATASLTGSLTLPVKDKDGHEVSPGPMELSFSAQNINPGEIGGWLRIPALQAITGKATIDAAISATTAHPHVDAYLDIADMRYQDMPFKALSASITLDDDGIWVGRWVSPEEAPPVNGETAVRFAGRQIFPDGASTLQFAGPNGSMLEPLELFGYLPFRWKGPLSPDVPLDAPLLLYARLPRQGLDLIHAYAPDFPEGTGTLDGSLTVGGSLRRLAVQEGHFTARINELMLDDTDRELPDRLRDVVMDVALHSEQQGERIISVVDLRDLSGIYTRADYTTDKPKKANVLVRWLFSLFGEQEQASNFSPGALVVRGGERGAIRADLQQLFSRDGSLIPLEEIPAKLDYDIYAKVLRTAVGWRKAFQGTVTSYLHLGNDASDANTPLLEGVAYLEHGRINYSIEKGEPVSLPRIPLNPKLNIALWMGPDNLFTLEPDNPLFSSSVSARMPIVKHARPLPFAPGDQQYLGLSASVKPLKPPLNTTDVMHTGYWSSAFQSLSFAQDKAVHGTVGWVEGTLTNPVVVGHLVMEPNRSQVELPGGVLTFSTAIVDARFPLFPRGPEDQPKLMTYAEATGDVDGHRISAKIEGDLLKEDRGAYSGLTVDDPRLADRGRLPITFATLSTPSGAAPLTNDEIYSRLLGVTTLVSLLERRNPDDPWAPIRYSAGDWFLRGPSRVLAEKLGLETIQVGLDPATNALESTLITREYVNTRWGGLRLGMTAGFSVPQTWEMWTDYRLPDIRPFNAFSLRYFSLNANIDNYNEREFNLQWRREF